MTLQQVLNDCIVITAQPGTHVDVPSMSLCETVVLTQAKHPLEQVGCLQD